MLNSKTNHDKNREIPITTSGKNKNYFIIVMLVAAMSVINFDVKAQNGNNCANSISITPDTVGTPQSFQCNDSVMWFSFVADSSHAEFNIYNSPDTSYGFIKAIYLYNGNCNNLNLIDQYNSGASRDSIINLFVNNLSSQNYYFVMVKKNISNCLSCNADTANFSFSLRDIQSPIIQVFVTDPNTGITRECHLPGCDLGAFNICEGDYLTFTTNQMNETECAVSGYFLEFRGPLPPSTWTLSVYRWFFPLCGNDIIFTNILPTVLSWPIPTCPTFPPGNYTVRPGHRCSDGGQFMGDIAFPITITVGPPVITSLTAQSNPGCVGIDPVFTSSITGVSTPAVTGQSIVLDFGDGHCATDPLPFGSPCYPYSPILTYYYSAPGTYTCTLTATNRCGTATATQTISILAPYAAFSWTQDCSQPLTFNFTDNSQCEWHPLVLDWDFGDGSAHSTVQNPSHTYSTPGDYIVILTMTGTDGSTYIVSHTVHAYYPPSVSITPSPVTICQGQLQVLTASGAPSYLWSPSTGLNISSGPTVGASPTTSTIYTVTGFNVNGCTSTATVSVTVLPFTQPVIDNSNQTICAFASSTSNAPVTYCTLQNTPLATYAWSVSPATAYVGSLLTGTNCVTVTWDYINFPLPPAFATITVIETDANGCTGTTSLQIFRPCGTTIGSDAIVVCDITAQAFYNTYSVVPTLSGLFTGSSSSYTFSNNFGPSHILYINGKFTIDADVTFSSCTILFGPLAKILMPLGNHNTLNITCSNLEAGCQYMWHGIEVSGVLNTVNASGNSCSLPVAPHISGAETAINSGKGGQVFVNYYDFHDNYIGIAFNGDQTACSTCYSIQNNVFYNSSGLIAPRLGEHAHTGIDIHYIHDITIGTNNVFHDLDYGIISRTSRTKVLQNNFYDIINFYLPADNKCTECPCPNGTAVCGTGELYPYYIPQLNAGTSADPNSFTNCKYGIYTMGAMNDFVLGNYFQTVDNGITVHSTIKNLVFINSNTLNDYLTGIACIDNYNTYQTVFNFHTFIVDNNLNWGLQPPRDNNLGIGLWNATVHDNAVYVASNNIDYSKTGIQAISYSSNYPQFNEMRDNQIQFSQILTTHYSFLSPLRGIRLQSTSHYNVIENIITNPYGPAPNANVRNMLIGVNVENSPGNQVVKNTITGMGSGIYCAAKCQNSTLACNHLVGCWDAFYFANADISDQLPGQVPQANEYNNVLNPSSKMEGNLVVPATWYWNGTLASILNPTPATAINLSVQQTSNSDNCSSIREEEEITPDMREGNFGKIVRDEKQYQENPDENRYNDRQYAFEFFIKNPSALVLGTSDDNDYINFFADMAPTNIGTVSDIKGMMDSVVTSNDTLVDMSGVKLANGKIVPVNVNEGNRKIVNEIYMDTWLSGLYDFTSAQTAKLTAIAYQNPLFGGNAVYGARVLLGIDPDSAYEGLRVAHNETNISDDGILLYPNPARDEVTVLYHLNKDEKANIELLSLTGSVILSKELNSSNTEIIISTDKLSSGVYLCSYIKDGNAFQRQKLVIIK